MNTMRITSILGFSCMWVLLIHWQMRFRQLCGLCSIWSWTAAPFAPLVIGQMWDWLMHEWNWENLQLQYSTPICVLSIPFIKLVPWSVIVSPEIYSSFGFCHNRNLSESLIIDANLLGLDFEMFLFGEFFSKSQEIKYSEDIWYLS